jgi:hypothetical protein
MTERRWRVWFLAGMIAGPLGTVIHESGHYLTARILELPGTALHATYVSYTGSTEIRELLQARQRDAASQIAPMWKVALAAAGGPVVSLLILGVTILCRRRWLLASVAVGFAEGWRFSAPAMVGAVLLLRAALGNRTRLNANVDEFNVARAMDVNPLLVILPVVLAVAIALVVLVWTIPRADRWRLSLSLGVGLALSLTVYMNFI